MAQGSVRYRALYFACIAIALIPTPLSLVRAMLVPEGEGLFAAAARPTLETRAWLRIHPGERCAKAHPMPLCMYRYSLHPNPSFKGEGALPFARRVETCAWLRIYPVEMVRQGAPYAATVCPPSPRRYEKSATTGAFFQARCFRRRLLFAAFSAGRPVCSSRG